jgi:hypothetical protein
VGGYYLNCVIAFVSDSYVCDCHSSIVIAFVSGYYVSLVYGSLLLLVMRDVCGSCFDNMYVLVNNLVL